MSECVCVCVCVCDLVPMVSSWMVAEPLCRVCVCVCVCV